jgi:hypothetical protein
MAAMTAGLSAILLHQVWCWGKGRVGGVGRGCRCLHGAAPLQVLWSAL